MHRTVQKRVLGFSLCGIWVATVLLFGARCRGRGNSTGPPAAADELAEVVSVNAVSPHFVEVRFDRRVDEDWADPERYELVGPDGTRLAVLAVELNAARDG